MVNEIVEINKNFLLEILRCGMNSFTCNIPRYILARNIKAEGIVIAVPSFEEWDTVLDVMIKLYNDGYFSFSANDSIEDIQDYKEVIKRVITFSRWQNFSMGKGELFNG